MRWKSKYLKHLLFRIKNNFWNKSNILKKSEKYTSSLPGDLIRKYNKTRFCRKTNLLCFAPFSNLYFGMDGNICACCYNRTHVLGQYHHTTIQDTWYSIQTSKLRESIKHGDLTSGCYPCMHQWLEGAFDSVLAKNYDSNIIHQKFPSSVELELSNACNLQCIMCNSRFSSSFDQPQKQGSVYDSDFVEEFKILIPHLKKAKFLGGEPFLIPVYYKIWETFIKINPRCELIVTTNGTILNEKIKNLLKEGNFSMVVSVDSFHQETYERIRINADFTKTMKHLDYLVNFCKEHNRYIGIVACYMKQNWEEIPEMIQICNSRDIPITFNRVWKPPECAIWNSERELLEKIIDTYEKVALPGRTLVERKNRQAFKDILILTHTWLDQVIKKKVQEKEKGTTDIQNLKTALYNKLQAYVLEKNIVPNDNDIVFSKLDEVIDSQDNEKVRIDLISLLKTYPPDLVHREILFNDVARLKELASEILSNSSS